MGLLRERREDLDMLTGLIKAAWCWTRFRIWRDQTEWPQTETKRGRLWGLETLPTWALSHRVQGQNVNTGTPSSPFFYSIYSRWHSIIHLIKLGSVSLDPGRSRLWTQAPLGISSLILDMRPYTAVSPTHKKCNHSTYLARFLWDNICKKVSPGVGSKGEWWPVKPTSMLPSIYHVKWEHSRGGLFKCLWN